jgi:transcriptional regulator with XRE-family HTH domain
MPAKQPPSYPAQKRILDALGERLRLARLRRKLTIDIASQRAGISRMTLFRAEAGSSAIALGTLLRILSVLGLESDLNALARDDKVGRLLQDQALPERRRRKARAPPKTTEPKDGAP